METYKAFNYLKFGVKDMVKQRYPTLSDAQVDMVIDKLIKMCKDTDLVKIVACFEANMDKAVREVLLRREE